ncbi:hypothetical protein [uncultured Thiodictyon sp.]|uniref:hypothetical protein n=1 Tax=uncultured Thiodictyon sp. TaxID=1846217 RepID=UPI0025D8ABB6|nr:hypothetical protein [uncultured Thiodictyon sp.]
MALASPFTGSAIEALPVPARWLRDVAPGTAGVPTPDGAGGYRVDIGQRRFQYGLLGLRRAG